MPVPYTDKHIDVLKGEKAELERWPRALSGDPGLVPRTPVVLAVACGYRTGDLAPSPSLSVPPSCSQCNTHAGRKLIHIKKDKCKKKIYSITLLGSQNAVLHSIVEQVFNHPVPLPATVGAKLIEAPSLNTAPGFLKAGEVYSGKSISQASDPMLEANHIARGILGLRPLCACQWLALAILPPFLLHVSLFFLLPWSLLPSFVF